MARRRPRRLRIGNHTWKVLWSKKAVVDLLEGDESAGGACDVPGLRLAVEPLNSLDMERSILLHEILHACFEASSLPISGKMEEQVVATLTNPLFAVLRDNRVLREYLFEDPEM